MYVDTYIPFGLRSAPYLFNRLSTTLYWIAEQNYDVDHLLHYLVDFLNQAHAWFPNIDPVRTSVCVCVCVCVRPQGY